MIAAIVNETESKAKFPESEKDYIVPGYARAKIKGERQVLESHGRPLKNGVNTLNTTALRLALTYGEEDHIFTTIITATQRWGGRVPRFAADGGKHQLIYAGNAAWGLICAKNSLKKDPKHVGGLPVNLTDDTPTYDISRLLTVITSRYCRSLKISLSSWKIPLLLGYLMALVWILLVKVLNNFKTTRLQYDPRVLVAYWGSLCYW